MRQTVRRIPALQVEPAAITYSLAGSQRGRRDPWVRTVRIAFRHRSKSAVHLRPILSNLPEYISRTELSVLEELQIAEDLWESRWKCNLYAAPVSVSDTNPVTHSTCDVLQGSDRLATVQLPISVHAPRKGIVVHPRELYLSGSAVKQVAIRSADDHRFRLTHREHLTEYPSTVFVDEKVVRSIHVVKISPQAGSLPPGTYRVALGTSHPESPETAFDVVILAPRLVPID